MTFMARRVLEDCEVALQLLEKEENLQRWRVHWAAAVALIRAIGHVLYKVDCHNSYMKKISKQFYDEWNSNSQEHVIFREFIEKERNNLL